MTTELKPYDDSKIAELERLSSDYASLVVTKENIKEADKARLVLKNARLDIQKVEKHNDNILKNMRTQNKEKAALYIALIEPVEIRLQSDIDGINAEIEMERRKEQQRIDALVATLNTINQKIVEVSTCNDYKMLMEIIKVVITQEQMDDKQYGDKIKEAHDNLMIAGQDRLELLELRELKEKALREKAEKEAAAKMESEEVFTFTTDVIPATYTFMSASQTPALGLKPKHNDIQPVVPIGGREANGPWKLFHLGYHFTLDSKLTKEQYEKIAAAISDVLDNEEVM
jgi:hypothetical protein